jgi:hypothetical protein
MKNRSKLILSVLVTSIPGFFLGLIAHAQTSTITLPAGFNTAVIGNVNDVFTGFSSYITLIIGVLLALVAIEFLIKAFHK